MTDTLVTHATTYAASGFDIFPVRPTDKTPLVSQYQATTDETTIAAWWKQWSGALIGHRLPADIIILDIDPRHGGHKVWMALRDEQGNLPSTRYHASGRGDGGGHLWFQRPDDKLSVVRLDAWAKDRGLGEEVGGGRWVAGIDILHHSHRYTILPPSPHPETGEPYRWVNGPQHAVAVPPVWLVDLITDSTPPVPARPPSDPQPDSIADWYSANHGFSSLLPRHGWTLRAGDGDGDGSRWRHPTATSAFSATVRYGCLFVYSPNTPFEVTAPGDSHGYTPFRAFAVLEHNGNLTSAARAARELKDGPRERINLADMVTGPPPGVDPETGEILQVVADEPHGPQPIIWHDFWNKEHTGEDWIVEPLVPRGRQVALWAKHKTGKSLLSLEIAAAVATGTDCLGQRVKPADVMYVDYEMTEDDLHDRLSDMGYGPDSDLSRLYYYLLPSLPPLDEPGGGEVLAHLAIQHGVDLVVIDTMARAVKGDENDADTYRAYYRNTGLILKQESIAVLRLDHGGKDATKGQRGSSGKGDDVDVVWQLVGSDNGLTLKRDATRLAWVPESLALRRDDSPLRHVPVEGLWPARTGEIAGYLDELDVEVYVSSRVARAALTDAGHKAGADLLSKAIKYRKQRLEGLIK